MKEQIVSTWLKTRIPISNFMNKFDKFNKKIDTKLFPYMDLDKAIHYYLELMSKNYEYRFDRGDRIRSIHSVWNRAHAAPVYHDDCDGMAALAYATVLRAGFNKGYLFTFVPMHKIFQGHTVFVLPVEAGTCNNNENGFMVFDYWDVFFIPGEFFYNIIHHFMMTRYSINYIRVVYSIDQWVDNKWKNIEVKTNVYAP